MGIAEAITGMLRIIEVITARTDTQHTTLASMEDTTITRAITDTTKAGITSMLRTIQGCIIECLIDTQGTNKE